MDWEFVCTVLYVSVRLVYTHACCIYTCLLGLCLTCVFSEIFLTMMERCPDIESKKNHISKTWQVS